MHAFIAHNPDYAQHVRHVFEGSPFLATIGARLDACGPGWCESHLEITPALLQQHGFVHAGVQATLADHTAGAAAATLMAVDQIVLTIEFKINLLRPALGRRLRCRSEVLRPGSSIVVAESDVFAIAEDGTEKRVAKAMVSLALKHMPAR